MKRVRPFAMLLILTAAAPILSFTQNPSQPTPSDPADSCKRLSSVKNATALRAACERTLSTTRLPDYLCQQNTKLINEYYEKPGGEDPWTRIQGPATLTFREIVAQVRFADGNESYTDIQLDGRPTNRSIVELSGATGEFSSVLQSLFDPQNQAEFTFSREDKLHSKPALLFDFRIKTANNKNFWFFRSAGKVTYPGYAGQLWIDQSTGQPMRLEMHSTELPRSFRSFELKVRIDYAEVAIGDGSKFLLPIKADSFACGRHDSGCLHNSTTFSNFRKFKAEHRILPTE